MTLSSQAVVRTRHSRPWRTLQIGGLVVLLGFALHGLVLGDNQERAFYGVEVGVFALILIGVVRQLRVAGVAAVAVGLLVALEQAAYVVSDVTRSPHRLAEIVVDPILLLAALAVVVGGIAGTVLRRTARARLE